MAVGTYKLPICDGCKLPWLPVGWTQDSDPRNPDKPLRCGKCKSIGWDREFTKQQKADATSPVEIHETLDVENWRPVETAVNPFDPTKTIQMPRNVALNEVLQADAVKAVDEYLEKRGVTRVRCKHRMTDCPICHPKEAA